MRPLKLKLRGFLTYKNEMEIDFTRLYEKKIFVISGDTGSGKTSIFDAITYALYGEVARGIDQNKLRSDFLNENDPYTYVNLIFEVDGRIYEIERIPNQFAKKTKANQNIKSSVILYDISEEKKILTEKKTDTDKKIIEIIGLDKNQFTKVMLLAQGEFQEFLQAKSDDRTKLLGDIFKTSEYKEIQEKIKNRANIKSKNMEIIDEKLETLIYQYPYISEKIDRDIVLVHDFENILKSIETYKLDLVNDFKNISLSESELEDQEKEKIREKERANTLNVNIKRFYEINIDRKNLLEKEEIFNEFTGKLNKSSFAKNIKIYEDRYEKSKKDLEKAKNNLHDFRKDLDITSNEITNIKSDYDKISENQEILNSYKIKLNDLKNLLDSYEKFVNNKEKYQKVQDKEIDLEKKSEQLEKLVKEIEEVKEILNTQSEEASNSKNDILSLKEKLIDFNNKKKLVEDKLIQLRKNFEINEKILLNKSQLEDFKKEKLDLSKEVDKYIVNQRLIDLNKFIEELNDTNICPVCGDKHSKDFEKYHTYEIDIDNVNAELYEINSQIARIESQNDLYNKSIIDIGDEKIIFESFEKLKENIEKTQDQIDNKNNNLIEINDKISQSKEKLLAKANELEDLKNQISILENFISENESVKVSYLANKDEFEDIIIDDIKMEITGLEEKIKSLNNEISNLNSNYNELQRRKAQIETSIENTEKLISQYKEEGREFEEEFSNKLKENFADKDEYLKSLEDYDHISSKKSEIDEFFKNLERINTLYEDYKIYKDKDPTDIGEIEKELESLEEKLKGIRQAKSDLQVKLTNTKQTIDQLIDLSKSFDDLSLETQILQRLSKIADGSFAKVAGREKIDFETFVLTYYFDKILTYANKRLYAMSNGQFSMVRKSYGDDLRSKHGLDLEILDANTGKKRPATTLSGGESFLASLSLALGLSDEISAENGGIKIDTLFIDEGFGTLSEDYLQKVIEQIEKLSYENKFIGLISHVDELKEAIDAKILVNYTSDQGSFIEVKSW